jgi:4-amino-4-deoxy-L-arabinose transferase-like glycosyltransferase
MANGTIAAVKHVPGTQGRRAPVFDMPEPLEQSADNGWHYLLDGVFLSVVCGCLFFFRLGAVGLFDGAGANFAESAREMVETGNYVVPQLNFQVIFGKPILSYWLTSTAYNIFGVNEFAAHFWSAVLASILVACTYGAVRQLADRSAALFSSLILACAPLMVLFGRVSCDQMVFCTTLGFALCAMIAGVFLKHKVWLIPGYACLGLSVLANGPMGLVIFVVAFAIYLLAARPKQEQIRALLKNTHPAWGLPVLAVVCLPWFCCAAVMTDGQWTNAFFASHTWLTLAGPANYVRAFTAFAWGFAPWILFLPDALKMAFAYGGKNNQGWRARRLNVIEQRKVRACCSAHHMWWQSCCCCHFRRSHRDTFWLWSHHARCWSACASASGPVARAHTSLRESGVFSACFWLLLLRLLLLPVRSPFTCCSKTFRL